VRSHVIEYLCRVAGRPIDLQAGDFLSLAQSNSLLKSVGAEAAPAGHVPVDGLFPIAGRRNLNSGANRRAVRLLANELYGNPVVTVSGILKEYAAEAVPRNRTAELHIHVHVAIAVPVAAGHGVTLLQVPRCHSTR